MFPSFFLKEKKNCLMQKEGKEEEEDMYWKRQTRYFDGEGDEKLGSNGQYCFRHIVEFIPSHQRESVGNAWYTACKYVDSKKPLPDGSQICTPHYRVSNAPLQAFQTANTQLQKENPTDETLPTELVFFQKAWSNMVRLVTAPRRSPTPPPPPPPPPKQTVLKKPILKKPVGRPRKVIRVRAPKPREDYKMKLRPRK